MGGRNASSRNEQPVYFPGYQAAVGNIILSTAFNPLPVMVRYRAFSGILNTVNIHGITAFGDNIIKFPALYYVGYILLRSLMQLFLQLGIDNVVRGGYNFLEIRYLAYIVSIPLKRNDFNHLFG